MGVNITYSEPKQEISIDETQNLPIRGNARARQGFQGLQNHLALPKIAKRDLADHERVRKYLAVLKQTNKGRIGCPQMVDLYRRVDNDQRGCDRLRGTARNRGSLPPNRANRRALSRSMSALSASRTSADFS